MREIRNIGELFAREFPMPDRARLLADLSRMSAELGVSVEIGRLSLVVPLEIALGHLPASSLLAALSTLRRNAGVVLSASAVLDADDFADWCLSNELQFPREVFKLLPEGVVVGDADHGALNDLPPEPEDEVAADLGVGGSGVTGEALHQQLQGAAEEDLLRAQPTSLVHPEPLVPRRATPPP